MSNQALYAFAAEIANFYKQMFNGDIDKANEHIERIGFTDLRLTEDGRLGITVKRPGIFIGKRGEDLEKLQAYLGIKTATDEFCNPAGFIQCYDENFDDPTELYDDKDFLIDPWNGEDHRQVQEEIEEENGFPAYDQNDLDILGDDLYYDRFPEERNS